MTKRTIIVSISILLVGLIGVYCTSIFFDSLKSTPVPVALDVEVVVKKESPVQEPHLRQLLQSVGATQLEDLTLVYLDEKKYDIQLGEYNGTTVEVAQGLTPDKELRTVAHEYLHYVWYKIMTTDKRIELNGKLQTLLANDAGMQKRVAPYVKIDRLNNSELFSIYCTESTDSYMLSIVDECNKYIDRSKLVLTR